MAYTNKQSPFIITVHAMHKSQKYRRTQKYTHVASQQKESTTFIVIQLLCLDCFWVRLHAKVSILLDVCVCSDALCTLTRHLCHPLTPALFLHSFFLSSTSKNNSAAPVTLNFSTHFPLLLSGALRHTVSISLYASCAHSSSHGKANKVGAGKKLAGQRINHRSDIRAGSILKHLPS